MTSIALVTHSKEPYLTHSDVALVIPLTDVGFDVHAVAWDNPKADWSQYDVVIIRSTWDYHLRIVDFDKWLKNVHEQSRLFNAYKLLQYNVNKIYLGDLQRAGIKIIPTVFFEDKPDKSLKEIMEVQGWQDIVIKPTISASADSTWRIDMGVTDEDEAKFTKLVQERGAMVQQFAPQIAEGEYSLVFFNGEYSHTAQKVPSAGEIFVQEELGGSIEIVDVPQNIIEQAKHIIIVAMDLSGSEVPLYARVDGLIIDNNFVLMELECVEPELYFDKVADASQRFVVALQQALSR